MQKVIVQIDWYTKIILTLIAVLLAGLLAESYTMTKPAESADYIGKYLPKDIDWEKAQEKAKEIWRKTAYSELSPSDKYYFEKVGANRGEYSIIPIEEGKVWVLEKRTGRLSLLRVISDKAPQILSDVYLDEILKWGNAKEKKK